MRYLLALDQGTTSSRAILFDEQQNIVRSAQREFPQIYLNSGWVEHDPMEIWNSQFAVMQEAAQGIDPAMIAAIGITNQRETTLVWERATGRPIYNAIVWQCRRTAPLCEELERRGLTGHIRRTTGLIPDAYFSATKVRWILDHVEGAQERAERGELCFGTVDSWLLWQLTGGAVHGTDRTNASRTMMYDIHRLEWDDKLLEELNIPRAMLPQVYPSAHRYGVCRLLGGEIPITGMAGDQQAALFGQCCFSAGEAKNTYGTGCFLLVNTGETAVESRHGLVTTLAATGGSRVQYALEGSVFVGGAVIQWLRDELHFFKDASEAGIYASQVEDSNDVYFVPAFTGLGAPYWDMHARGALVGLTRSTRPEHIIRAAEESIAYQSMDVLQAMERDMGAPLTGLRVDGGASRDVFLMQFQADILNRRIFRPVIRETTALGAAYLAGLTVGVWDNTDQIKEFWRCDRTFLPQMEEANRSQRMKKWSRAVESSRGWQAPL